MNKKAGKILSLALALSLGLGIFTPVNAAEKPKLSFIGEFKEGLARARETESGKFGYVNENWEFVIKPQFDGAEDFKDGFAVISKIKDEDAKDGVIDKEGKIIVKPKFGEIKNLEDGIVAAGKEDASYDKLLDVKQGSGKELKYAEIAPYRGNLALVTTKKGKKGFINREREEVIKPVYDDIAVSWDNDTYFGFGAVQAVKGKGKKAKFTYFDENGKKLDSKKLEKKEVFSYGKKYGSSLKYADKDSEDEEEAVIYYDRTDSSNEGIYGYFGILGKNGKFIAKPEYGILSEGAFLYIENDGRGLEFSEGLLPAEKNGRLCYINEKFEEVLKPNYKYGFKFYGNLAGVVTDGKTGFINKKGKEVTKPKYFSDSVIFKAEGILPSEGMYKVSSYAGGFGFVNGNGKEVIKPVYDEANDFSDGVAWVLKRGRYGLIDKTGKMLISHKYKDVKDFYNGVAFVKEDKTWMLINKQGKKISNKTYSYAEPFVNGLAYVKNKKKWGFVNSKGKEVIKVGKYDILGEKSSDEGDMSSGDAREGKELDKGFAVVVKDDKWGIINAKDKKILELEYDDVYVYDEKLLNGDKADVKYFKTEAGKDDSVKYGVIEKDGKIFLDFDYDEIEFLSDELIMARKGANIYHINTEGETVFTY